VVSFTPRPLHSRGKSPRYLLDRRLGGPQSRSGLRGEEKILDPDETRTPDTSVIQPVTSRYTDYAVICGTITKIQARLLHQQISWLYLHQFILRNSKLVIKPFHSTLNRLTLAFMNTPATIGGLTLMSRSFVPCLKSVLHLKLLKKKLRGLSPQANYTDRATAACRRS
jgi:hypothetical protein